MIIFLSFRLNNTKTRYINLEKEYLAIIYSLAEVK